MLQEMRGLLLAELKKPPRREHSILVVKCGENEFVISTAYLSTDNVLHLGSNNDERHVYSEAAARAAAAEFRARCYGHLSKPHVLMFDMRFTELGWLDAPAV